MKNRINESIVIFEASWAETDSDLLIIINFITFILLH